MSCDKNKSFQVSNLFNELKTEGDKRIARLNLGVKDSDSLIWGNIEGNIYDQEDLVQFVEMLKMLASQTGTVVIFRLNDNTIDRTVQAIPEGWQDTLPDTTSQDELWMTQAVKQGGVYKVSPDGIVWGIPVKINYSNVVDAAQQAEIDTLREQLNELIQNQEYTDNIVNNMNQVTVNSDGSISVTGRDGQVSIWQHQDLGNYLLLGNIYGDANQNNTSYFVINKTGLLQAHNAIVHGTIYATDGQFAGRLEAATGSFRGEVTATSGRIGGWQIVDGTLKPENVPTTALIGKIQASQVDFGSTLTDLKNLIQDDYNNKITTLRTNLQQSIDLVSTRFQLTNDSITSSVQEIREIQNTHDQKIRTLQNGLNKEKNDRNVQYQLIESKIQQTSDNLMLGIQESLLAYSNKFKDYITAEQLESSLSLLSNQISAKVSKIEYNQYNRVIESKFAELTITPEEVQSMVTDQITGVTSTWTQTVDSLQTQITEKGNLLAQLGITPEGIIMKGNTLAYYATGNIIDPVFACNADGSGRIAKGTISWDTNGNVTLGSNVVISWNDIQDRPQINPDGVLELSIKDIVPIYHKSTSQPSKPVSEASISNQDISNQWTTKIPTIKNDSDFIFKCNKITHSNDEITYTTVEKDEALTIAQRSKNRLDQLFNNGDHQGTQITQEYIYTGAFGTQNAYVMQIQSAGENPSWQLNLDGSGFLANNNINWDVNGNLTVNGTINAYSGSIGSWDITETAISSKDIEIETVPEHYIAGNIPAGTAHLQLNFGSEEDGIVPELSCTHTTANRVMYYTVVNSYGVGTGSKRTITNEFTNFIGSSGSGWLDYKNINWDINGELTIQFINSLVNGEVYNIILNKNGITYVNESDTDDTKSISWKQLIDSFD